MAEVTRQMRYGGSKCVVKGRVKDAIHTLLARPYRESKAEVYLSITQLPLKECLFTNRVGRER